MSELNESMILKGPPTKSTCYECNPGTTTSLKEYLLGIVTDRVITCALSDECTEHYLSGEVIIDGGESGRVLVLVNEITKRIVSVSLVPKSSTSAELSSRAHKLFILPTGSTIVPGFIDCHVHLTIARDDYQMDHLRLSSADKVLRALRFAQDLLFAGFTTVRSAGDADTQFPTFALARSIERGEFHGPRIVGAGHYLSVTGGGGDISFIAPDNCPCGLSDGVVANGKDEMIRAVRNEIKYGSDWIKLLVTGAFMSASTGRKDSPENTHFSPEELQACVHEAKRRQVHVMAHAHGADGIALAARLGCRSIEHASYIDKAGIDACLEQGTWIVPTFTIGEYFSENGSPTGAQDRLILIQKETNARYYSSIQSAVKAGVKVALGSDFVGWDPAITAREFRYLVELGGLSPFQSLLAGTSSAAELLDIEEPRLGKILPGYAADLVAIQGNPLEDISLLEKGVIMVVGHGVVVRGTHFVADSTDPDTS